MTMANKYIGARAHTSDCTRKTHWPSKNVTLFLLIFTNGEWVYVSAALCLCALGFFLLVLLPIFIPCFRLVCYRGRCIGLSHYLSLSLYLIMSAVSQFFELLICMPGLHVQPVPHGRVSTYMSVCMLPMEFWPQMLPEMHMSKPASHRTQWTRKTKLERSKNKEPRTMCVSTQNELHQKSGELPAECIVKGGDFHRSGTADHKTKYLSM